MFSSPVTFKPKTKNKFNFNYNLKFLTNISTFLLSVFFECFSSPKDFNFIILNVFSRSYPRTFIFIYRKKNKKKIRNRCSNAEYQIFQK